MSVHTLPGTQASMTREHAAQVIHRANRAQAYPKDPVTNGSKPGEFWSAMQDGMVRGGLRWLQGRRVGREHNRGMDARSATTTRSHLRGDVHEQHSDETVGMSANSE